MRRITSRIIILILVLWLLGYGANPLFAQAASPSISISPTSGPPGSLILVTGSGFSANEAGITITYDGINVDARSYGEGYWRAGIWADSQGGWKADFVVPAASPSGSHHIIDASGPSTLATTVPDVTFTMTPGFRINPTSGTPGSSMTVTGSGFSANEVGITVICGDISVASGISANSQGSWSATFVFPALSSPYSTIKVYGSITEPMLTPLIPPLPRQPSYLWLIISFGIILGAAILTLVFIRERLSATSRRGLAKGMRWAAWVIGVGGFLFYLLGVFLGSTSLGGSLMLSLMLSSEGIIFTRATIVLALASFFISRWREWLAGILLIISWVTPLGVVIYALVIGRHYYWDFYGWLGYGSPLLVAGLLFLLSWWLTRKTNSSE